MIIYQLADVICQDGLRRRTRIPKRYSNIKPGSLTGARRIRRLRLGASV